MLSLRQHRLQAGLISRSLVRSRLLISSRFNSSKSDSNQSPPEDDKSKEISKKNDAESVQSFKFKQTTSKSAPAPLENTGIEQLMKKDNKP